MIRSQIGTVPGSNRGQNGAHANNTSSSCFAGRLLSWLSPPASGWPPPPAALICCPFPHINNDYFSCHHLSCLSSRIPFPFPGGHVPMFISLSAPVYLTVPSSLLVQQTTHVSPSLSELFVWLLKCCIFIRLPSIIVSLFFKLLPHLASSSSLPTPKLRVTSLFDLVSFTQEAIASRCAFPPPVQTSGSISYRTIRLLFLFPRNLLTAPVTGLLFLLFLDF